MRLLTVFLCLLCACSLLITVGAGLNVQTPLSKADRMRVKRDWLSDIMWRGYQNAYEPAMSGWTGWRCYGTNGIFLDCSGK